MDSAIKINQWLTYKTINSLEGMANIHQAVCKGKIPTNEGLIIELNQADE